MNNKGFTLVEVAVTCAVIGILMAAMSGPTVKMIQTRAAVKTSNEINSILEAEKNYYIKQYETTGTGSWAPSTAALQTAGYIPSAWSGNSPFGQPYNITSTTTSLTVTTDVHPTDLQGAIQAACPLVTSSGNNVSSSIPVPGQEPSLTTLLHKAQDNLSRTADFALSTQKSLAVGAPASLISNDDGTLKPGARQGDVYSQRLYDLGKSPTGWLSDVPTSATPQVISVVGTTDISTGSTSWVDMPGMTYTGTFPSGNICVFFSAPVRQTTSTSQIFCAVVVDGVTQKVTRTYALGGAGVPMAISWAGSSTAASHTIKIQWAVSGGTGFQEGSSSGNRSLIILQGLA